ncbi:hypothetical protein PM082_011903 [Marasmius tenuissimus]|nr:hypothetical protein PM082_011903 [Marasmius tenuissimus]
MSYQSGRTYKLINGKARNVALDLSTQDNYTVAGWNSHDGAAQKWTIENLNGHWTFRNVGSGKYLAINGDAKDGTPVVGSDHAFGWDLYPDNKNPSATRIFVPGAPAPGQNLDLSDHGNAQGGTKVTLWTQWEGEHQTWLFQEA